MVSLVKLQFGYACRFQHPHNKIFPQCPDRANLIWYGIVILATIGQWMFNYSHMTAQSANEARLTSLEQSLELLPDQLSVLRKSLQQYEMVTEQVKKSIGTIQTELHLQSTQIATLGKDIKQSKLDAQIAQHLSTELSGVSTSVKSIQERMNTIVNDIEKVNSAVKTVETKQMKLEARATEAQLVPTTPTGMSDIIDTNPFQTCIDML
jgi:chromosome segregation ATPase